MTYTIPEKKIVDVTANTAVADTGYIALLNGLSQGTSVITRVGQKIVIKSIDVRLKCSGQPPGATPTAYANWLRVLIVWDSQPNGALPPVSDIIEDLTTGTGIVSPAYKNYLSRFKILWNRVFDLVNVSAAAGSTFGMGGSDKYFSKTNLLTSYADSTNGDITDIITGALYFVAVGAHSAAANYPTVEYYSRLRFYDN